MDVRGSSRLCMHLFAVLFFDVDVRRIYKLLHFSMQGFYLGIRLANVVMSHAVDRFLICSGIRLHATFHWYFLHFLSGRLRELTTGLRVNPSYGSPQ